MKVEINHLTKVIQGNVVLDDINACFSCASGENGGRIYGIQGINGSGKTMLIHCNGQLFSVRGRLTEKVHRQTA